MGEAIKQELKSKWPGYMVQGIIILVGLAVTWGGLLYRISDVEATIITDRVTTCEALKNLDETKMDKETAEANYKRFDEKLDLLIKLNGGK